MCYLFIKSSCEGDFKLYNKLDFSFWAIQSYKTTRIFGLQLTAQRHAFFRKPKPTTKKTRETLSDSKVDGYLSKVEAEGFGEWLTGETQY